MIVPDTSFLISLFGGDAHTAESQAWVRQAGRPIAVTALNRYEFANALRFGVFRKAISEQDALGALAAFHQDLQAGALQVTPCDFAAVIGEAERLSELHTIAGGHRSFDILLVATASQLAASKFLSFDRNQRVLAQAAGLSVGP